MQQYLYKNELILQSADRKKNKHGRLLNYLTNTFKILSTQLRCVLKISFTGLLAKKKFLPYNRLNDDDDGNKSVDDARKCQFLSGLLMLRAEHGTMLEIGRSG